MGKKAAAETDMGERGELPMGESTGREVFLLEDYAGIMEEENLQPQRTVGGFRIRPGFYEINGASAFPNGVNFTVISHAAVSCELLLFHREEQTPYAVIPFPREYRIGSVFSMFVFGLRIDQFEYAYRMDGPYAPERGLIFDRRKVLLDPYAKAVTGQSAWGKRLGFGEFYKARVVHNDFDWGNSRSPGIPLKDSVIYELHVRGFTKSPSAGVCHPGTFDGVREKIPYLKGLGINVVELMPVFEFDEMRGARVVNGRQLLDYWGYNPVGFFAPNTSYASEREDNREGRELKELVRELHENGMEVILDVVFNHTAEGNEQGPYFSFKGIDNNVYYMLTPDGQYYNFSGCGNTLNCNHPLVRDLILNCLRYWVVNYRVDGFRFDLATILGRSEDGSPMNRPPLLESLAYDPILYSVDLIAEAWDAGGLYQVGTFPSWNRWAEWNGKYRDDIRSFLKGDAGFAQAAALRITGSPDLYPPKKRGENASVNFVTCHDGFTLYDLYAYNGKHNEDNGWGNTDGADDNRSWNCGAEGPCADPQVQTLRMQMVKNACAVLLCSRGTPMFFAGDEFGNTQFGNNNAYCQDNEISWLDWSLAEKNRELLEFFRFMIWFRRRHRVIRGDTKKCTAGFPCVSLHGIRPWAEGYGWDTRMIGVMYAGRKEPQESGSWGPVQEQGQKGAAVGKSAGKKGRIREETGDDIIYLGINTWWERQEVTLPQLPEGSCWVPLADTSRGAQAVIAGTELLEQGIYVMNPRSVLLLEAKRYADL